MNNVRTYFTMADCDITIQSLSALIGTSAVSVNLVGYILHKYNNNWIIFEDFADTASDRHVADWKSKFKLIYDLTKDRYGTLISLYEQEKNNLFAKIGSKTTTKFNDTPQNGGDFSSDNYTTNVTQSETEVMPAEVMDRLENIHSKFKNLYAEWCDEFKPLFGEEL